MENLNYLVDIVDLVPKQNRKIIGFFPLILRLHGFLRDKKLLWYNGYNKSWISWD